MAKIKQYSPKIIFGLDEFLKNAVTNDNFLVVLNGYTKSEVNNDNKIITEKEMGEIYNKIDEINNKVSDEINFPEFKIF